jgi:hypothetical protein
LELLLSPHPDDLVYSAFTQLNVDSLLKHAVTFFNVSGFNRLSPVIKLPAGITSIMRTVEDRAIMAALGVQVTYLFLEEFPLRGGKGAPKLGGLLRSIEPRPRRIVAPLGVGSHPDHVLLRDFAVECITKEYTDELLLYEDLPYAFYNSKLRDEEIKILESVGQLRARQMFGAMDATTMARKLMFCRMYFSQPYMGRELKEHASRVGEDAGTRYAERFFVLTSR